jgi:hypothetical protein
MKAHRHRKLSFQEISIINPNLATPEVEHGIGFSVNAVIDPPTRMVQMNHRVATLRGLRGFRGDKEEPGAMTDQQGHMEPLKCEKEGNGKQNGWRRLPMRQSFLSRRSLVKNEDKQIAQLSISHENSVAVAVCMAVLDASEGMTDEMEPIIDNGSGDPIHEPAWGDHGFRMAGTMEAAN